MSYDENDGMVVVVDSMPIEGYDPSSGHFDAVVVFAGVTETDDGEDCRQVTFGVDAIMASDIISDLSLVNDISKQLDCEDDGHNIVMCYVEQWQVLS